MVAQLKVLVFYILILFSVAGCTTVAMEEFEDDTYSIEICIGIDNHDDTD